MHTTLPWGVIPHVCSGEKERRDSQNLSYALLKNREYASRQFWTDKMAHFRAAPLAKAYHRIGGARVRDWCPHGCAMLSLYTEGLLCPDML
jgi:hypothetical protein